MTDKSLILDSKERYAEEFGFHEPENYAFKARKGLDAEIVREISRLKGEPAWMTDFRLRSLDLFRQKPMPSWGADLADINFDDIYYYIKPAEENQRSWDDVSPDVKRTFDRLGIPEAERKFLAGVGAQYECLAGDSRVFTPRGLVPIRDIRPGDRVFSYSEEESKTVVCPVRAVADKGEREVYDVKVGVRSLRATANHPFLALVYERQPGRQRGRYHREWRYLHQLKSGDLVAVAKALPDVGAPHALELPVVRKETTGRNQAAEYPLDISHLYKQVALPQTSSEDLMWLFGLYLGDGCIHRETGKDKARVEFAIPETDPQLQQELAQVAEGVFGTPIQRGDAYRLTLYSTIAAQFFEINGFGGNAHTKRVPAWVYTLPRKQQLAFLGGYLDSDGSVRAAAKNHEVVLTCTQQELLEDIRALVNLCGLTTSRVHHFLSDHPYDKTRAISAYRMMVYGQTTRLGSRSERRRERLGRNKFDHTYTSAEGTKFAVHTDAYVGFAKIDSITPAGRELVYDIEIDGPHNFVAEGLVVHNSEMVYHSIRKDLEEKGIVFLSTDDGLRQYPELFQEYFGTLIPPADNKFSALNSAVWSGGSFIYVPKGVRVEMPLQAYFRINAKNMGQFERTLIVVDEGAYLHYIEGCTAPTYSSDSLHAAVVEIFAKKNARCRYTTIQNWSTNVYNLVTKRAAAYEGATMEWVDGNLGCLAEGSTVTTPTGLKAIEQLQIDDAVLAYDEQAGRLCFRRVVAKRFSGLQPVQTVSVGERKLRVTANHPFYSYLYAPETPKKLGRYRLGYVRADQLKEAIIPRGSLEYGQPYRLRAPNLVTQFKSRNQYADDLPMTRTRRPRLMDKPYTTTDDLMWLFGYWVGDGHIEVKSAKAEGMVRWAKVGFSTPVADRARAQLLQTMSALIETPPAERPDGLQLSWNSKELAEFFQLNGFQGLARTKRVPAWVWSVPESQRSAFVAGYLDADGYVLPSRRFVLKSANRELLEDMASLLVTLGMTSRLYTEFDQPRPVTIMGQPCVAHSAHRLEFHLDERLLQYVSAGLRERAEKCRPAILTHHRAVGRSNIELPATVETAKVEVSEPSAEPVPTWDIEVEGTGNFVSQGFIVHNSKVTMKYPSVYLMEPRAHGEILSIAFAGAGQHLDAGSKVIHRAPNTSSKVTSKSISKGGGRATYRGLVKVHKGAVNSRINVVCDALLLDEKSRSDTYPVMEVDEDQVSIGHEASVTKVGEDQLFYLMSRGLSAEQAATMVVGGFIEPLVKELPMEYAVELNRLVQLQMEGSVG